MIETISNFPQSRFMHLHNVGLKMMEYARNVMKKDETFCEEMYILGLLHDSGYLFETDYKKHDSIVGNALKEDGYKYYKEIMYHSVYQEEYDSDAMRLLYFGDATVDAYGNWVTLEERLLDLKQRHGEDSDVYKESLEIADKLREWGFDDSLDRIDSTNFEDLKYNDYCSRCVNHADTKFGCMCLLSRRIEGKDFFCYNFKPNYNEKKVELKDEDVID